MSKPAAIAALVTCWAAGAAAQPVERICGLPEVIDTVALELQRRGTAGVIDARNPGEVTDADGASCSAWLVQSEINTNDPGPPVRHRVVVQGYRVRRLANSLAVDLTD